MACKRLLMLVLGFLLPVLLMAQNPVPAPAGGVEGKWKFKVVQGEDTLTFLLNFSKSDSGWVGDFLGCSAQLKVEPKVDKVEVKDDRIKFTMNFGSREFVNFDGVLIKDAKKINGSFRQFGGALQVGELHPSKLKKLDDPVDLARENLQQLDLGSGLFDAGLLVLSQASAKKLSAVEVRSLVDKLTKASATYGPRWESSITLKLARALADQPEQSEIALAQIRRAERMLPEDSPLNTQIETFELAAKLLTKSGKVPEAQKYRAIIAKLEAKDYADYLKTVFILKAAPFVGRTAKSDRVVVVEVISGVDAAPCAAVDLGVAAVGVNFKPTEVVVLNYHVHAPTPDPLTSPAGLERIALYGDQVRTMPTVFLNGKPGPRGGGTIEAAMGKFDELRTAIAPLLETPNTAKIALTATPTDKGFTAKAVVDVDTPSDKLMLRFVLTEDRVRYAGSNGLRYHFHVVRDLPGGAKGTAITKRTQDVAAEIDIEALRKKLGTYLDEYAAENEFPHGIPTVTLTGLRLTALLQNDAGGEILQAVQIELGAKK